MVHVPLDLTVAFGLSAPTTFSALSTTLSGPAATCTAHRRPRCTPVAPSPPAAAAASRTTRKLLVPPIAAAASSVEAGGGARRVSSSDDVAVLKDDNDDLLPILKRAMPAVASYDTLDAVTQANAEGRRVVAHLDCGDDVELFVKRVDASRYASKPWADLRRTLLYARTETRFYRDVLPTLFSVDDGGEGGAFHLASACHLAECDLSGLIAEDSAVSDVSHEAPPGYGDDASRMLEGRGASLVLDSLSGEDYYQDSPLMPDQAASCLDAVARLHASAWGRTELLRAAERTLSKPVYYLPMRNPAELKGLVDTWKSFVTSFEPVAPPSFFHREGVRNLGSRIVDAAECVSSQLDPGPDDDYATICHGDFKAMNVFLPKKRDGDDRGAVMIDFASAGVGYGMCDVAMHLVHAVHPDNLRDGQEERLVDGYLDALEREYEIRGGGDSSSSNKLSYPRSVAWRHYRLAVVDYFRFVCGRFWMGATPEGFQKRRDNKNTVLVNRNVEAAFALIEKVDRYLEEFEAETKQSF